MSIVSTPHAGRLEDTCMLDLYQLLGFAREAAF